VRAKIVEQGADVVANSPEEFRAFIREETARLAGVIRNSNIQLDLVREAGRSEACPRSRLPRPESRV